MRAAFVALAVLLCLIAPPAHAWDVGPTKGIVPLDRMAELYKRGDSEIVVARLDQLIVEFGRAHEALSELAAASGDMSVGSAERSILDLNMSSALHLRCLINLG